MDQDEINAIWKTWENRRKFTPPEHFPSEVTNPQRITLDHLGRPVRDITPLEIQRAISNSHDLSRREQRRLEKRGGGPERR